MSETRGILSLSLRERLGEGGPRRVAPTNQFNARRLYLTSPAEGGIRIAIVVILLLVAQLRAATPASRSRVPASGWPSTRSGRQ